MRLFKIAVGLLVLLCGLLAAFCYQLVDDVPLVAESVEVTPEAAEDAKRLLKQLLDSRDNQQAQQLLLSEQQLNHVFAVAARAVPRVRADASIKEWGSVIRITVKLPDNPLASYINVLLTLPPEAEGFEIVSLTVGGITVGRDTAHLLRQQLFVWLLGPEVADLLLHTVQGVTTEQHQWRIYYQFAPDLDKKVLAALKSWQAYFVGDAMKKVAVSTLFYHRQLCNAAWQQVSLAKPLSELMRLAALRSGDDVSAVLEHQALLQAMTLYYGSSEHNYLLAKLLGLELEACVAPAAITLSGRSDLAQHFLYSAVFKVMSDNQASFMVGEFKEMQDSLRGGSGFSFVDLLADQTGIQFATIATQEKTARYLQQQLTLLRKESNFFPAITGLPEGLSQAEWASRYHQQGAAYQQQLRRIEQRIALTPLFLNQP